MSVVDQMKEKSQVSDLQMKLASQIILHIKQKELVEGAHLKELELAEQFKVSRSPVRIALEYLEVINVVEQRKNRGYFLKKSAQECEDLSFELSCSRDEKMVHIIARDWFENKLPADISQSEIQKRYNLGRFSVSRILQALADQGVVTRQPGYGWHFEPTLNTKSAHDDSYDLRIILESNALLIPTFKLDQNGVQQLQARHNHILKLNRKKWNIRDLFQLDVDFHGFLAECSGNRFVIDAIERQNRLRRLLEYVSLLDNSRLECSCTEHLKILDALQNRHQKLASKLMVQHLKSAKTFGPSFKS